MPGYHERKAKLDHLVAVGVHSSDNVTKPSCAFIALRLCRPLIVEAQQPISEDYQECACELDFNSVLFHANATYKEVTSRQTGTYCIFKAYFLVSQLSL